MSGFAAQFANNRQLLPAVMALLPLVMAVVVYLASIRSRLGGWLAVSTAAVTAGAGLMLLWAVGGGVGEWAIGIGGYAIKFQVDPFGAGMAFVSALAWTAAMVFSLDYMTAGRRLPRYWAAMVFTMGSTLGVFLAGDLFTLFIFFELMTFASYALVAHDETQESMAAGKLFLYMGVAGGLCLAFSILLLNHSVGLGLHASSIERVMASGYFPLIAVLALIAFGTKAGMFPLHIWLPAAHPVAPAPASAILSGVLVKVGVYGACRVFLVVLGPSGQGPLIAAPGTGVTILALGLTTMILGAIMALAEFNVKRVLAYSSISQMGYVLTAVGAAAILGRDGAMGFAGAFFHMLNHVVFKAAAFMAIGYLYMKTHELDIRKLGGLGRMAPVVALCFVAAWGAIMGLPGFSGFASKTLIHHALAEAYHDTGLVVLLWAERVFILGSVLTAAYFCRLARVLFGPAGSVRTGKTGLAQGALAGLTVVILGVGAFPLTVLTGLVAPAAEALGFDAQAVAHLYHLQFSWTDAAAVMLPAVAGVALWIAGSGPVPGRVRVGVLDRLTLAGSWRALSPVWGIAASAVSRLAAVGLESHFYRPLASLGWVVVGGVAGLDRAVDRRYEDLARYARRATSVLCEDTPDGGEWNQSNLNMGLLLLAVTLIGLLLVMFVLSGGLRA